MNKWFCYRWLPSTILPNIKWAFMTFCYGIKNIWKWLPIIFFDDWIDWSYLTNMMEFKLRDMAINYKKYGNHVGANKNSRQMLICAILLKRLTDDDYWENCNCNHQKAEQIREYDKEYLFKIIKKHLEAWWD